jgi:hypothetical protein
VAAVAIVVAAVRVAAVRVGADVAAAVGTAVAVAVAGVAVAGVAVAAAVTHAVAVPEEEGEALASTAKATRLPRLRPAQTVSTIPSGPSSSRQLI